MAPGADAFDNFLSEITTLIETDRVHLFGLLRQGRIEDILAVPRLAILDTDDAGVLRRGGLHAGGFEQADDVRLFAGRAVDPISGLARDRERRDRESLGRRRRAWA